MKKTNIIALALVIIFSIGACESHGQNKRTEKKEKKKIEKVAYGYLDAMGNYRISDAYQYATIETQEKTLRYVEQAIMPKTDPNHIKAETPAKITITGITLTSDTTAIVMFHKSTPVSERNNILNLVKRNKEWKADVKIEVPDIIKTATEKANGPDTTKLNKMILREVDLDTIQSKPRTLGN